MSKKIKFLYKGKAYETKFPSTFSELLSSFLSLYNEDKSSSFTFKFKDSNGDEINLDEDDESFNVNILSLKKCNTIVYVEKIENLSEINESNDSTNNNEAMRSTMKFDKMDNKIILENEELKKQVEELKNKNKELLKEKQDFKKIEDSYRQKNLELIKKNQNEISKYEQQLSSLKNKNPGEQKKLEPENKIDNLNIDKNLQNEINDLKIKLEKNKKELKIKEQDLNQSNSILDEYIKKDEEYKNQIKNYENQLNNYKKELEKSKLELINLQNNKDIQKEKEKEIYTEEMKKKYEEMAKENIEKIKVKLNQEFEKKIEKIKTDYDNEYKNKEKEYDNIINQISQKIINSNLNISNLEQNSNQIEHKGIQCKKCFINPIIGLRYKCVECNDYNLCQKCEEENAKKGFHDSEHNFIKIRKPQKKNQEIIIEKKEFKENEKEKEKEKQIDIDNKVYSYSCSNILTLNAFIYEGTPEKDIEIILKNNGREKWPNGKTKLIYDKTSQIKGDDIYLQSQNIDEEIKYNIAIKNLQGLKDGEYRIILWFNVNGINFGDKLTLQINIKKKKSPEEEDLDKYIDKINDFRDTFSLSKEDYSDDKLLEILKENNFEFEASFGALFN